MIDSLSIWKRAKEIGSHSRICPENVPIVEVVVIYHTESFDGWRGSFARALFVRVLILDLFFGGSFKNLAAEVDDSPT